MKFVIPEWKRKMKHRSDNVNKLRNCRYLKSPTRKELKDRDGAVRYCSMMRLSHVATKRVIDLVTRSVSDIDFRDHRSIPKEDRVPRSLEYDETPPRYWDIAI